MDLLLLMIYAGICTAIFKIFKIPLNKWTVPTAILGGFVLVGTLVFLMNYNHPYAKYTKEFFISVPIIPAVSGIVISVDVENNVSLKKGDPLYRIDPKPYALAVERKRAQLADSEQMVEQNRATFEAAESRVVQATADRDRAKQTYDRYRKEPGVRTIWAPRRNSGSPNPTSRRHDSTTNPRSMASTPASPNSRPNWPRPSTTWSEPRCAPHRMASPPRSSCVPA